MKLLIQIIENNLNYYVKSCYKKKLLKLNKLLQL